MKKRRNYGFTEEQNLKAKEFLNNILNTLKTKVTTIEKVSEDYGFSQFEPFLVYFRDTRIPEWELALWAWYEEDGTPKGCYFIGEHILLVDKFKPSRTWLSTQDIDEFVTLLGMVTNNPYESFAASKYYSTTIEEFRKKHPDINAKEDYEKSKKHEEDKKKYQKEAEETALSVYLPKVMESVPYLSGAAIVDNDRFGGISYPRYELYVTVSPAEYRKRNLDFEKVRDDVEAVLETVNQNEMKKFIELDNDFDTKRFVIDYSLLGWNIYENMKSKNFGVRGYLMLDYEKLFEIASRVVFRKRENGKYTEIRY